MWMYRLLYILKSTRQNVQDHRPTLIMSVIAVAFTLLLFASYVLLLSNLQAMGKRMGDYLQITLYLDKEVSGKDRQSIQERLTAMDEVEAAVYCTPEQALTYLKESLGKSSGVLETLSENPLPASFEVRLKTEFQDLDHIRALAARLEREEGVEQVDFGGDWIGRFFGFVRALRWLGGGLGLLLLAATVIVISSTLSLGFYARKEEIEILRLVGASESYVKLPFFWEAMIQGTGGAVVALFILWALYQVFRLKVAGAWSLFAGWVQFQFLSPGAVIGIIFLGAFVGGLSCMVSFSRFSPRP
jgi:cell division transport system permease protein